MFRKIWAIGVTISTPLQSYKRKRSKFLLKTTNVILAGILSLLAAPAVHAMPSASSPLMQTGFSAAPTNVTAKRLFTNADEISWTDASTNEFLFTVEYRFASVKTWKRVSARLSTSSGTTGKRYAMTLKGLPTEKYYCYRVSAVDVVGKTSAPVSCAGYRPSNPKILKLSINWFEAVITFKRSQSWELKYRISYKLNGPGRWHQKTFDAPPNTFEDANISVPMGVINKDYCFYVTAINDLGNSSPSNTVCGNTGPYYEG